MALFVLLRYHEVLINPCLSRMMYWTDWGQRPKIESAWMDGQQRRVLLDEDLGWPTGLALDYVNGGRIYWCDSKENIIESMTAEGSERKIIMSGGQCCNLYALPNMTIRND